MGINRALSASQSALQLHLSVEAIKAQQHQQQQKNSGRKIRHNNTLIRMTVIQNI